MKYVYLFLFHLVSTSSKYVVDEIGCKIYELYKFPKNFKNSYGAVQPNECQASSAPEVIDRLNFTHIIVRPEIINCCIRTVRLMPLESIKVKMDGLDHYNMSVCTPIENQIPFQLQAEVNLVQCNYQGHTFKYTFSSIIPKESVTKKLEKQKILQKTNDYLNVLIIGIDSVSRINFERYMKNTYEYLKHLNAIEMYGLNSFSSSSFPNLKSLLIGSNVEATKCVKNHHYDKCPVIWRHFNNKGYITGFAEEMTLLGTFHFQRDQGFQRSEVDYDWSLFDYISNRKLNPKSNNKKQYYYCHGNVLSIQNLYNYAWNFINEFKNNLYFLYLWSVSYTHDAFGNVQLVDDIYKQLLKKMDEEDVLENSLIIFLSDHGFRYVNWAAKVYQLKIERAQPFLFMILPKWFRDEYNQAWSNLLVNQHRLVTTSDLYKTLIDVSNLKELKSVSKKEVSERATSLFHRISGRRTCSKAEIPTTYCNCFKKPRRLFW